MTDDVKTPEEEVVQPTKRVGSLKDTRPREIDVVIHYDDDYVEMWPAKMMTYQEWVNIGRQVAIPRPPINGVDKMKRPIYDRDDPTYLSELDKAATRRAYLRLAAFLQLEDFQGLSIDERADLLESNLSPATFIALTRQMEKLYGEAKGSVESRAATFQQS